MWPTANTSLQSSGLSTCRYVSAKVQEDLWHQQQASQRTPRHSTGVGSQAMEDPSQASQEQLWNFRKSCLGDGPLLQSTGMCLVSKQWDNSLWVGWAPEPKDFPFCPIPDASRQNQTMSDSLQQQLSSPHSSPFGEWRGELCYTCSNDWQTLSLWNDLGRTHWFCSQPLCVTSLFSRYFITSASSESSDF